MMLYRNTPVFSLRREIDRLFDDTFGGTTDGRQATWMPPVDVQETAQEYRFELELPGVAPEAVEITTENGVLTIRGEKTQRAARDEERGRVHIVERSYGSFVRSFQLPQGVREDDISATFEHGLLRVRVPKAERPQPRRIRIEGGEQRQMTEGATPTAAESGERVRKAEKAERVERTEKAGA